LTQFLYGAGECDLDGVARQGKLILSALSEHIESAGVHSGDSSLILPPVTLPPEIQERIKAIAIKIIAALEVTGPCNIQFVMSNDEIYVIECNLRASRSFPFVSKILHVNFIELATELLLGKKIAVPKIKPPLYVGVKVPQFSYQKLKGADPVLKVEMNSTGEVAAIGDDVHRAYLKAMLATGIGYPKKLAILLSLGGMSSKMSMITPCKALLERKFTIYSTTGTAFFLRENGIPSTIVGKIFEHINPSARQLIEQRLIDFAVIIPNSPHANGIFRPKKTSTSGYHIRRLAVDFGIPVFSNLETAHYFIESIIKYTPADLHIKLASEY
jgi:carbamoyl-phosphate synthase/aspartate carbamoyltransferase